jgi:hypothetical protein
VPRTNSIASHWIPRLISRDERPDTGVRHLVEQGIRPRLDDLTAIVAEMFGSAPDHPRVLQCVTSIHAQWMLFVPNPIASRLRPKLQARTDDAVQMAAHIAEFSLAGIRAVAGAANR